MYKKVMEEDDDSDILIEEYTTIDQKREFRKYKKGGILGKGGFSICYECQYIEGSDKKKGEKKEIYAAKEIIDNSKPELIQNEIEIYKILGNKEKKNIINFKTHFTYKGKKYILFELCENKDFKRLIQKRKKLKEIEVKYYIFHLINTVKYLHENNIIHRDLKLENLFLNGKMELKIGDFGLAKKLRQNETIKGVAGTLSYMAPEILQDKEYSYEVDIWAIGVIMYFLLIGELPFKDPNKEKIAEKIQRVNYSFPKNAIISNAAKDLIKQILVLDPKDRPTLNQILIHDFFEGLIPRLLPKKFLTRDPSIQYIKNFMKDADSNGIENKEVKHTNLKEEKLDEDKNLDVDNNKYDIYVKNCNINYINKYGLGYKLSNNTYGVCFRDCSYIIYIPGKEKYIYIEGSKDKEQKIYKKDDSEIINNKQLNKKIGITIHFYRLLNQKENSDLSSGSESRKEKEEIYINEEDENAPIYVQKYYVYNNEPISLRLSNKNLQIFFKINESIILSKEKNEVIFIEQNKEELKRSIYSFEEVKQIQNYESVRKIKYAKNVLEIILSNDDRL